MYILFVLAAGTLWGFMGLFRRFLGDAGIDSAGVILLRCGSAAILFLIAILMFDRKSLKISMKDLWCFLGTGICSMLFFTYCYFQAIEMLSLSAAAILLYTAPFFVVLLSAVFFGESFDKRKLVALVLAFVGCCCVSGLGSGQQITVKGILFGLGAGVGYALYSIFARFALDRGYNNFTINLYTHSFAAVGAGLLWGVKEPLQIVGSAPNLLWLIALLGLLTCFLPYLLYTYALTGLEAGKASIYANIEPVVATLVGIFIFHEQLNVQNLFGIALVLIAVLILSIKKEAP